MDWGFLRSDATYDVVSVWDGHFFRLDAHIDRFFRSIEELQLKCPVSKEELGDIGSIRDTFVGFQKHLYIDDIS